MNSILDWATGQAARELGINPALAFLVYKSYWKFVRETIASLDLENMSEEDFSKVATNFNIPYIGKLYTGYDKIEKYRRKIKYLENHVKVKGNKAHV